MNRRHLTACLVALTLLGAVLRFYHLDYSSLWHDEICTALRVRGGPLAMLRGLTPFPVPPLYYLLMWCWTRLFGDGEFWLRLPSLLASVISIPLIYLLARRFFNPRAGLWAAFLLSISPYSITYAQEAKMYSLVWMLGLLSFLYFDRLVRERDRSATIPYLVFTAMALYTLYVGFFFLVVQGVIVLLEKRGSIRLWARPAGAALFLGLPWFLFLFLARAEVLGAADKWWPGSFNYLGLLYKLFLLTSGNLIGYPSLAESILGGVLLLASLAVFRGKRLSLDFSFSHRVLLGWILVPVVIAVALNLLVGNFFNPWSIRYLGFIHLPLLILIGKGLANFNPRWSAILIVLIASVTFRSHLLPYYQTVERFAPSSWPGVINNPPGTRGENWRGLFLRLRKEVGANDLIVLHRSVSRRWPLIYYFPSPPCPVMDMETVSGDTPLGGRGTIYVVYRQERGIPDSFWEIVRPGRTAGQTRFGRIGYFLLTRNGIPPSE